MHVVLKLAFTGGALVLAELARRGPWRVERAPKESGSIIGIVVEGSGPAASGASDPFKLLRDSWRQMWAGTQLEHLFTTDGGKS